MAIKLPAWLHDKRAVAGLAAAGGVGLFVLVRKSKSGGGTTPAAGAAASQAGGGSTTLQPGTYDSTGTDIYNGLQALYAGQDARWTELVGKLGDVQSRLPPLPTGTTPTPTPTTTPGAGTRKAAGSAPISALTPKTSGRWSWANLVDTFYNTTGWSSSQKNAAAQTLEKANAWRVGNKKTPGFTAFTTPGNSAITLPVHL
jgi:hypothetical protein